MLTDDDDAGPQIVDLDADACDLETSANYRFADWPNTSVPRRPGVYTIWDADGRFIYVGMAGRPPSRQLKDQTQTTLEGLWGRLKAHAAGRRSGNQFCVYVCDRFVVPGLTAEQQREIGAGELSLDVLTRAYIRANYTYRFTVTPDADSASKLELKVRRGALATGKPFLNPK
jgi:hypothetical protein